MAAHLPSLFDMLRELIALPSVSCVNPQFDQSNREIIERLATWCSDLGFHSEILPIPHAPHKWNLVATLGQGTDGLVLAGHTDTVPFDANRWHSDPFRLTETNNCLYGLGIADMKAFFALALMAARQFEARQLRHPLILLATADEESSMSGAKALAQTTQLPARHALIGEPTNLRPVNMHKGIMMESIRLRGLSGHSSNPALGNSALEGMHTVITTLLKWRAELQARYHNPLFNVPVPTLNFGSIHGGDNPNRICGDCELHIDLRSLPRMEIAELRTQLQQRVTTTIEKTGLQVEFTSLFHGIDAMETATSAEIVQIAEQLTCQPAEAVAFGTEAPFLRALGMEVVILGAGDIAQAHQPNEYLALDRLQPMITILTQMIQHFCCE